MWAIKRLWGKVMSLIVALVVAVPALSLADTPPSIVNLPTSPAATNLSGIASGAWTIVEGLMGLVSIAIIVLLILAIIRLGHSKGDPKAVAEATKGLQFWAIMTVVLVAMDSFIGYMMWAGQQFK